MGQRRKEAFPNRNVLLHRNENDYKTKNFVANDYKTKNLGKGTNDYLLSAKVTKSMFTLIPQSGVVHTVMATTLPPSLRWNATTVAPPFKYRISPVLESSHSRSAKQQHHEQLID